MDDANKTYNLPTEGWGYYMNQDEKEEAQQRAYEQYAEEQKTERLIRKLTALAATIMKAQDNMYFSDEINGNWNSKNTKTNGGNQTQDKQEYVKTASSTKSVNESAHLRIDETLLGNDSKGIDHTPELLYRAREFCHGKNVDGIALYTGMKYVPEDREPKRKDGGISEDTINRELILAFKAGEDYDLKTISNVREIMSDWLSKSLISCFEEYMMELLLIPVCCHSKESTQVRWWRFMKMVVDKCEEQLCNIENGFGYIQFIKDAPIPSHFNKGKAPQAKYKYKNMKGKNVVLVDDICASRNTLRRNIKMIEKAGGHVVACFVFADSNTEEV